MTAPAGPARPPVSLLLRPWRSVLGRIVVTLVVMAGALLTAVGIALIHAHERRSSAHVVDVAGRTRLLAGRLELLVVAVYAGEYGRLPALRAAEDEHRAALDLLAWGNSVRGVSPCSLTVRPHLDAVRVHWRELTRSLARVDAHARLSPEERTTRARELRRARQELVGQARAQLRLNEALVRALTREAEADARGLVRWLLGALLVGVPLAVVALVESVRTLRPVGRLEEGARRVAAGDLQVRVPAGRATEVERLGASFNAMTRQLAGARAELLASHAAEIEIRELRHHTLLELVPEAVVELDPQGRCAWHNRAAGRLFGPEAGGRAAEEILPGEHPAPATLEALRAVLRGERARAAFEVSLRDPQGEVRTIAWRLRSLRDEAGRLNGTLCSGHDLSKRKRSEEERVRLATALQQVNEAICITDRDGRILFVNPAFEAVTGYTSAEVLGDNPRVLKSGEHGPEFYEAMWAALHRGEVWRRNFINRRQDGTVYESESSISPVHDPDGRITHFVAVQRDVTGLRQAQKLEALGELVAGIAHEINNPSTFVNNNLAIVEEFWEDARPLLDAHLAADPERLVARLPWTVGREELPRLLRGLRTGAERISTFVNELKAFARPDAGTAPVVFEVGPVVENALVLAGPQLRKRRPAIEVRIAEDLPRLRGVPARLEQVLVNLLLNAADFVPPAEGRIEVAARRRAAERTVELSVSDNGRGVAEEVRGRVFDPFFSTRHEEGGTGLGLAISRRIVTELGGTISLVCPDAGGTRFVIAIPTDGGQELEE